MTREIERADREATRADVAETRADIAESLAETEAAKRAVRRSSELLRWLRRFAGCGASDA